MNSKMMVGFCIGLLFLLSIVPAATHAAVPQLINYQGKLMEDGTPLTGFRSMTFSIWDNDTGGDPASGLWNETQSVEVTDGIYNVELGLITPLPMELYNYDDLFLQVDILHPTEGLQRLSPLTPFDSTVFAIKAAKAEDADTLDGKDSTALDQSAHVTATNNPHSVTAAQTGAASMSDIAWSNLSGIPGDIADGDQVGILTETDPTILDPSVKDGVSWGELSGIPSGFLDGVDNTGIIAETDPQVGTNSLNYIPKWNGSALVSGSIFDNGNVGIGTTSPENGHKLHVNGLAMFELGSGRVAMSTPGARPGFIAWHNDGTRSDIVFHDDGVFIAKNELNAAAETDNGLFVHENGRVGIGTLTPVARLEVRGEVRTTDTYGGTRLWGQGRPNVKRYGTTGEESGLCTYGFVKFGLSSMAVEWSGAAAACPAGTWVCTAAERGPNQCLATRPDWLCDGRDDSGKCIDWDGNGHVGWVADQAPDGNYLWTISGINVSETGEITNNPASNAQPVWCCSSLFN